MTSVPQPLHAGYHPRRANAVIDGLTPDQADGIACAVCAVPFRVGDRSRPVGHTPDGSQVFACADTCDVIAGGAR